MPAASAQALLRSEDFRLTWQKGKDRAALARMGLKDGPRRGIFDAFLRCPVAVTDIDRKTPPLAFDDRGLVQEGCDALDIERR